MKRIAAIALYVAATLITTGTAMAQNHGVKAAVPFSFNVNGTWLPAGEYTIGSDANRVSIIGIGSQEMQSATYALGLVDASEPAKGGLLLFHRYGERCFLSEVRYAHSSTKIRFPVTKTEKKARERAMESSLRVNDDVQIAMN
jgi:hypothetical protein